MNDLWRAYDTHSQLTGAIGTSEIQKIKFFRSNFYLLFRIVCYPDFILLKFDSRTRNTARVTGKYVKALLWNKKLYIFMTAGRKRNYNSK